MQLNEDQSDGAYKISAYGPDFIKINDIICTDSLILSRDECHQHWPVRSVVDITAKDIQLILERRPALVILGTGKKMLAPPGELLQLFYDKKIAVEFMDTPAACRTMTILFAEQRDVIGALVLDPPE